METPLLSFPEFLGFFLVHEGNAGRGEVIAVNRANLRDPTEAILDHLAEFAHALLPELAAVKKDQTVRPDTNPKVFVRHQKRCPGRVVRG